MKKIITGTVFVLAFAGYGLFQYFGNAGTILYVNPTASPIALVVPSQTQTPDAQPTVSVALAEATPPPTPKPKIVHATPAPTSTPAPTATPKPKGQYVDGTYTGSSVDVYYGNVQIGATISGGKLVDVSFLQYPSDRSHSMDLSNYALPILKQEAIQAQNANVDAVSGASETSKGFQESLADALSQAKS